MLITHPNPDVIEEVMSSLEHLYVDEVYSDDFKGRRDCDLDFSFGDVNRNECRTVACLGGYFTMLFVPKVCWLEKSVSEGNNFYVKGANAFAKAIFPHVAAERLHDYLPENFEHVDPESNGYLLLLTRWAGMNYDLWGNLQGDQMFFYDGYEAFGLDPDILPDAKNAVNLGNVVLHFFAVARRVRQHLAKTQTDDK